MTEKHITATDESLIWAQLAYAADGADPMLALLTKVAGPSQVFLLLQDIAAAHAATTTATSVAHSRSFSQLLHFLMIGYKALDYGDGANLGERLLTSCERWSGRLNDLAGLGSDELEARLTCDHRYELLSPACGGWPEPLNDLLLRVPSAPPLCLWVEGTSDALTRPFKTVGIVGSRESNDYGNSCANTLASRAAATGYTVISGGATGIDAAAHWGALHSSTYNGHFGAPTVAVFAGGLKNIGPSRNLRLFDEIVHHGGALVSELPPGSVPFASRFLARNRLIAALSSCVVVAQARYRSGALNTAQWAAEMGRVVLAVPGSIDSPMNAGCNRLIAEQKATILTDTNVVPLLPPHEYSDSDAQPSEQGSLFDAHDGHAGTESNELGSVILTILQRRPLSRADLDAELTQHHSLKDVDDSHIGQALGLLELEGKINTSDSGLLTLPKR